MAEESKAANPHARLETWIWVLIYGGLFAVIVGVATGRESAVLGWSLVVPGAIVAAVGVALIFVRARLGAPKS